MHSFISPKSSKLMNTVYSNMCLGLGVGDMSEGLHPGMKTFVPLVSDVETNVSRVSYTWNLVSIRNQKEHNPGIQQHMSSCHPWRL
jgi:hypothetical protein